MESVPIQVLHDDSHDIPVIEADPVLWVTTIHVSMR